MPKKRLSSGSKGLAAADHRLGFVPRSVTFTGQVSVPSSAEKAFQMFSPLGEKLWVPEWNPELLYPGGVSWEEGLIFRTREETGDAIWIVSRLELPAHLVVYHRVEPDRYVARIEVRCDAAGESMTMARIDYSFIGLSESGNREITAMNKDSFAAKMKRWEIWINQIL